MDPFYISGYDPDHSNPSHLITHKCSPQDVIISRNPLLMKKITELKPVLCVKNMTKKCEKDSRDPSLDSVHKTNCIPFCCNKNISQIL